MIKAGQYLMDGTAVFIIRNINDGTPVGRPIIDDILRDSYIKRNGALIQRSSYPSIARFMQDHPELITTESIWISTKNKYTWGDGTASSSTTIRVPDDRVLYEQLSDSLGIVAAGLPNIYGMDTYVWRFRGFFNTYTNKRTKRRYAKYCNS